MSEIAGFKYETWEKSSNIAHRDFQHTTMAEDFEKAPRRKWGKNHNKPSPNNKNGCEANDGGKHIYEKVRIHRKIYWPFDRKWKDTPYVREICIGCGKKSRKSFWNYDGPVYSEIDERDMKNGHEY